MALLVFWEIGKFFDHHEGAITALFTIVLAFSTIALWRSTHKLWKAGENQISVARDGAEAAKRSADAAIGSERAWVLLTIDEENFEECLEKGIDEKTRPCAKFHFKNYGKTPAFLTDVSSQLTLDTELPKDISYKSNVPWVDEIILAPGETYPYLAILPTLTVEQAFELSEGHLYLWLYGRVIYRDVWGNERETRFCRGHDGRLAWFLPEEGGKQYNENT